MDVEALLARNLIDQLPAGLRPFIETGERPLVIIRGIPGAIVATDRRVLVERTASPLRPQVYPYEALTGAVAILVLVGTRRYVALAGPGLKTDQGPFEIGKSRNATAVHFWRRARVRESVAELNALIPAMNAARAGDAPVADAPVADASVRDAPVADPPVA